MLIGRMLARRYLASRARQLNLSVPVGCIVGLIATFVGINFGLIMLQNFTSLVDLSWAGAGIMIPLALFLQTLPAVGIWFFAYVGSAYLHENGTFSPRSPTSTMRFRISTLLMMTAIVAVCLSCLRMNTVPFLHPQLHWVFDKLRGHEMRFPIEVNGYRITLVQRVDSDFGDYNTFFEISSPAHQKVSTLDIRILGPKWRRPNIYEKAGKIYFRDGDKITNTTPFIDVDAMTVTSPYTKFPGGTVPLDRL